MFLFINQIFFLKENMVSQITFLLPSYSLSRYSARLWSDCMRSEEDMGTCRSPAVLHVIPPRRPFLFFSLLFLPSLSAPSPTASFLVFSGSAAFRGNLV